MYKMLFYRSKFLLTNGVKLAKLIRFSTSIEKIDENSSPRKSNELSSESSHLFQFYSPLNYDDVRRDMIIYQDFLSKDEENTLLTELEPYLQRMRYEFDHWDDAIHGYRETEKLNWNEQNQKTIERIKKLAFPKEATTLQHIHVLDITKEGYIKPHVDSVRFCGNIITGLSLLSTSVMRLIHEKNPELKVDVLLPERSLYIMRDIVRFKYTHEILADKASFHQGKYIPRERRISIMCRNEPENTDEN